MRLFFLIKLYRWRVRACTQIYLCVDMRVGEINTVFSNSRRRQKWCWRKVDTMVTRIYLGKRRVCCYSWSLPCLYELWGWIFLINRIRKPRNPFSNSISLVIPKSGYYGIFGKGGSGYHYHNSLALIKFKFPFSYIHRWWCSWERSVLAVPRSLIDFTCLSHSPPVQAPRSSVPDRQPPVSSASYRFSRSCDHHRNTSMLHQWASEHQE